MFFYISGVTGVFLNVFNLAIEIVGPKTKTLMSMLMPASFSLGVALDGIVAMSIRDWRTYQIVLGAPFLALMIFYFLLPESPRWLIATSRYKEAKRVIEKAAKINKVIHMYKAVKDLVRGKYQI